MFYAFLFDWIGFIQIDLFMDLQILLNGSFVMLNGSSVMLNDSSVMLSYN